VPLLVFANGSTERNRRGLKVHYNARVIAAYTGPDKQGSSKRQGFV